jgi:hypothetical protein
MDAIISLHLPKTAGSSFGKTLETHFGNSLLLDYADLPISKPIVERNREALLSSLRLAEEGISGIQCVHGHFLPIKYLLLNSKQKLFFLTWMRDPVERAISHYHYWQRSYDPNKPCLLHHERVIKEGWSLERFCLGPEFRNLYSQYMWGFPLEMFDFIGIVEFYEDDLAYLADNYLEATLDAYRLNVSDKKNDISPELREAIERHHDKDVQMYRRALQMRLTRSTAAN